MIAVIFDIDGTLVDSHSFEGELYIQAVKNVLGDVFIHDDWNNYENATDLGILNQIVSENKIVDSSCKAMIRDQFGQLVKDALCDKDVCKPIKGAIGFINHLCNNELFAVGYATGGWTHTALMKLTSAGLNCDIPLSTSDDSHIRTEIMMDCLNKLGKQFDKIFYFGDGFWDIKATDALGWNFVGIGPRLKGRCENWFSDFSDTSAINDVLYT